VEQASAPQAASGLFLQPGLTPFPATVYPPEAHTITSHFCNDHYSPFSRHRKMPPLRDFWIQTPLHTSYPAEWPILPSIPRALKGFRAAIRFSQVKLADELHTSRVSIERWEAGTARPFRGDIITLLNALIPIVEALAERGELNGIALPEAAGQLLNFAAAVVCPLMTRPTATYIGRDIVAPLQGGSQVLAYGVLSALTSSEVLINVDHADDEMDARFVPLAGLRMTDHATEPWEHEARALLRRLDPDDRKTVLGLARRLARRADPDVSP
jgi:hypothetical protein